MLWIRRLPASPPHPEPRNGGGGWAGAATYHCWDRSWGSLQQCRESRSGERTWGEQHQQQRLFPGLTIRQQARQTTWAPYSTGATVPRTCPPTDYRGPPSSLPFISVSIRGGTYQDSGTARTVLSREHRAATSTLLSSPSLPRAAAPATFTRSCPSYFTERPATLSAPPRPTTAYAAPAAGPSLPAIPAWASGSLRQHGGGVSPTPFSSLPTFPEPPGPVPRAAHTFSQRGRRPWYQTTLSPVPLAPAPPRTLPNPPRTRAHTTPSQPLQPPNTLYIRHSAPQSAVRYRECASRSIRRPVSAPVPSSFFYPPSPTALPFTPPFVPPYPSYPSLPSPPPAPRAASAGATGDGVWGDRYRGQLQIQTYQPDKYRSVNRTWSRSQRSDDRLDHRARGRTKASRTESNSSSMTDKRKRSLLRLCYFHLRFPHM